MPLAAHARAALLVLPLALGAVGCGSEDTARTGGGGGAGGYALPQFVRGAAALNPALFPAVAIAVEGEAAPTEVTVDDQPVPVTADAAPGRWWAALDASALSEGEHSVVARGPDGTTTAALLVNATSVGVTRFAEVGPASYSHLMPDPSRDQHLLAWIDARDGAKHAWLAQVDGAGRRTVPADVRLDPDGVEPVRLVTAPATAGVVALYATTRDFQGNPAIGLWLRAVGLDGAEVLAPVALNPDTPGVLGTRPAVAAEGAAAFALWADFTLPDVTKKVYWGRADLGTGAFVGPIEVADGSYDAATQARKIDDLQAFSLACTATRCAAAYRRQVYNAFVDLSAAKVEVSVLDALTGARVSQTVLAPGDWDIQEDPTVFATPDGGFVVTFAGTDTDAVLNEPDPCDASGRQRLWVATLDGEGALVDLVDVHHEVGQRFQAVGQWHPEGTALLWEDQREKCTDLLQGQNRLAVNLVVGGALEHAYRAVPGSRLILQSHAAAAPQGPNFAFAWVDERAGGSVLDPRGEVYFDNYWRP